MQKNNKDEFNWLLVCGECAFYSDNQIGGGCYHPENNKHSCCGFRMDDGMLDALFGVFWPKKERCGRKALYFQPKTKESVEAVKEKDDALFTKRAKEFKDQQEFYGRIENALELHIRQALCGVDYNICECQNITFRYRNKEGIKIIVDALLKQYDIKKKDAGA
ncbi:MAG: hypothetical protein US71_C0001G0138 [Parcubacteria group bacterium GW2011_GWD2_38_12]|uniref:Uncharacterized protein n=1 Tax=Candidatus Azambacteria bacterium RIFCSPLOWO2_01_FULL_37_9 TaxID=1797297 RepID=A0A1F5C8B8_9BACT|nr:MAG: hypothetical protein US06_C0002G0050 [Parcubacteria group bacterium GW2011_GWC2_36_17]KKQ38737.1 MAG: hypothetical protein US56_C0037G0007 [Candidatus Moranbacteria bacterium GW2011_GWF2_37_7]KKQ42754.1 MAG: hypothetical protein US61_C0021G0014 [Parcubacteria group bacterium GW2011_GWE2_37_8]KKQ52934.1 MAG: hypothetical protein US71_C0001G0138 [Parcubacteria group bacterium GW2011_GWD2_38_12]KKQ59139.1 MAG: hypothetical protein US79_C0001G0139 [Parcubacteria group bacterium GW2011_GWC1_